MDNRCEEFLEEIESSMDRRHIKLEERLTERIEKAERKHELATLNCLKNIKFNETHIIITVRIPFTYFPHPFMMYQPLVFPILINTHDHDAKGFTELIMDRDISLIIDEAETGYSLVGREWISQCSMTGAEIMCYQDFVYQHLEIESCLIALYRDDKRMI